MNGNFCGHGTNQAQMFCDFSGFWKKARYLEITRRADRVAWSFSRPWFRVKAVNVTHSTTRCDKNHPLGFSKAIFNRFFLSLASLPQGLELPLIIPQE